MYLLCLPRIFSWMMQCSIGNSAMHIALTSPLRSSRLDWECHHALLFHHCDVSITYTWFWSTLVQCQGSLWWSPYPQRFGLANLIAYKFPVTQFNCRATRGDTVLLLLTTFVMFWDKLSLAGLVHHSMIPFTTNRDNHRLTPHLLDHHLFINPTVWLFNCTIESTTTVPLCGLADHSLNYNWLQLHPRVAR